MHQHTMWAVKMQKSSFVSHPQCTHAIHTNMISFILYTCNETCDQRNWCKFFALCWFFSSLLPLLFLLPFSFDARTCHFSFAPRQFAFFTFSFFDLLISYFSSVKSLLLRRRRSFGVSQMVAQTLWENDKKRHIIDVVLAHTADPTIYILPVLSSFDVSQMKKICGFSFVCCCHCRRRRRRWQFIVYIFVLSSLPICALHAQWVWWCVVSAVHFSVTRCHCCWFCVFFHLLRWWWSDTDWERRRKPNNKSNWIEYMRSSAECKHQRAHTYGTEREWNCIWTMWTVKSEDEKNSNNNNTTYTRSIMYADGKTMVLTHK